MAEATIYESFLPKDDTVHTVATLVLEGANPFEFSVACEVFGLPRPELGGPWYDFRLCAPGRRVRINGGYELATDHDLADAADADTVIVPAAAVHAPVDPAAVDVLRAAHERGARLMSFCSGAFVLGQAGVLDGRRATTHWMYTELFRHRFPKVELDPNVLFVDAGDVLTSAGTAAGIDLALHVVRLDRGAEIARSIARRMVVPPHRDGGQAQYIDPPHESRVPVHDLAALLDWLLANVHRQVTVPEMAERAAMSERTFARRFKEITGTTPNRWMQIQRIHRAQELLETTDFDVDLIADRSGLGTAANLRQHFRRELDTTPSRYRRTFRGEAA